MKNETKDWPKKTKIETRKTRRSFCLLGVRSSSVPIPPTKPHEIEACAVRCTVGVSKLWGLRILMPVGFKKKKIDKQDVAKC